MKLFEVLVMQKSIRDAKHQECPWVFFRLQNGKPIRDFRGAWEAACKAVGLVDSEEKPTRLLHDLRRTGVRNLIRAGVPERVAMKISGHRSRSVFDRYNIVSERDLKEAASRLGSYIDQQKAALKKAKNLGTIWAHQAAEGNVTKRQRRAKLLN